LTILSVLCCDYKLEKDEYGRDIPVIYLFCRDKDRNRYILRDPSFEPYFYISKIDYDSVDLADIDKDRIKKVVPRKDIQLLDNTRTALQIITKIPSDVRSLKHFFHKKKSRTNPRGINTYEADVLFPYRFLIDKGIVNGIEIDDNYFKITRDMTYIPWDDNYCKPVECTFSNYRLLLVDVETKGDVDKNNEYASPLTIIGLYDNYTKEYLVFYNRDDDNSYSSKNILHFRTEKEMLIAFIEYLQRICPDIVASFTPFDLFYIIKRMKVNKLKVKSLSPIGTVSAYDVDSIRIGGIQYIDLLAVYKRIVRGQKFESLEAIALKTFSYSRRLGYAKQPLIHDTIFDTWNSKDYKNVIYYNLRDVLLIKRLDEELDIIEYLDTVRRIAGSKFGDALYAARVADLMYLRLTHSINIALPSRPLVTVRKAYSGAIVFKSIKGIHRFVLVLDYKSLYPNVMRGFNIGSNTLDPTGDIKVAEQDGIVYRYTSKVKSWSVEILDKLNPLLEENTRLTDEAKKLREFNEVKKLKKRRMGIKSIINGLYGIFAYSGNPEEHTRAARLYNTIIAESITIGARMLIEETFKLSEEMGYTVVAGDTDSLMLLLDCTNNTFIEKASEVQEKLQSGLQNIIKEKWNIDPSNFKLEIDAIYPRFIIFSKKRYSGITEDGDIIYKGIEIVRREQSDLTVETQSGLLDLLLHDASKEDIRNFTKIQIEKLHTYPLEKIAPSGILSKPKYMYPSATQSLKAFTFGNQILNLDLIEGERFYFLPINKYKFKKISMDILRDKETRVTEINPKTSSIDRFDTSHKKVSIYSDVAGFREASDLKKSKFPIVVDYDELRRVTIEKKIKYMLELVELSYEELLDETKNNERSKLEYYFN